MAVEPQNKSERSVCVSDIIEYFSITMKNEIATKQHKGDERNNILQLTELSYTHDNFQD